MEAKRSQSPVLPWAQQAYETCLSADSTAVLPGGPSCLLVRPRRGSTGGFIAVNQMRRIWTPVPATRALSQTASRG